jgi:hypothetical protein
MGYWQEKKKEKGEKKNAGSSYFDVLRNEIGNEST